MSEPGGEPTCRHKLRKLLLSQPCQPAMSCPAAPPVTSRPPHLQGLPPPGTAPRPQGTAVCGLLQSLHPILHSPSRPGPPPWGHFLGPVCARPDMGPDLMHGACPSPGGSRSTPQPRSDSAANSWDLLIQRDGTPQADRGGFRLQGTNTLRGARPTLPPAPPTLHFQPLSCPHPSLGFKPQRNLDSFPVAVRADRHSASVHLSPLALLSVCVWADTRFSAPEL